MNENRSEAPLTATVGERLKDDRHAQEVVHEVEQAAGEAKGGRAAGRRGPSAQGRAGARAAGRPFPWAALALAVVGWALLTGIGRGIGGRVRAVGAGARAFGKRLAGR